MLIRINNPDKKKKTEARENRKLIFLINPAVRVNEFSPYWNTVYNP